ncbi:ATP-binding protein [Janthinobacterium fluminis]|uniref:ATP-binding protein n=1 Tax=Janthinobacterium fluminis TaxID=2987524 RepID=A0ABT5JZI4_9BURK|nr:ATP-binding protein [Janthinobacterium fluminis]MDC8757845.1 ATP-binding protein [Janthinobacterium fluminis]
MKKFDLNIDRMLENWDGFHAIREIIANALDEQILTGTRDIDIACDGEGRWRIRDFGRGLRHEHFTMNENQEKLDHPHLIGKFGVGLKDALATFDRLGIEAHIHSKFCNVSFDRSEKHDFSDVITLHACISDPSDPAFVGTEFILKGCSAEDIEKAKRLFLRFSGEETLERTQYGEVLRKVGKASYIYINGIRVAEEENFLFSYNITSLTAAIKKALNRERTNVGRSAYSDRVKSILLTSSSEAVAKALVDDLGNFGSGTLHDEMKWTDVSVHASKITNASGNVLFLTDEEIMNAPRFVEEARAGGRQIITIPSIVKEKLSGQFDTGGKPIQDLSNFVSEWNDCFEFKFVQPENLPQAERSVFDMTGRIAALAGGLPSRVQSVKISETMRPETGGFSEARGLWTGSEIIVKRNELASIESYAAVLLHEIAHARSGEPDITIGFEQELTTLLGTIASNALLNASVEVKVRHEQLRALRPETSVPGGQQSASHLASAPAKKSGFLARLFGKK